MALHTYVGGTLVLLNNDRLIEWILSLRWLLGLVSIEGLSQIYISGLETISLLKLLFQAMLTALRCLLLLHWIEIIHHRLHIRVTL